MNFVFRIDASRSIGTGHIMRCLPIIEEAVDRGIPCELIGTVSEIDWLIRKIERVNIKITCVDVAIQHIPKKDSILIVDSYSIDINEPIIQEKNWKKVISISDISTPKYRASIYFHFGLDISWFKGNLKQVIYGRKYIPIRNSLRKTKFGEVPSRIRKIVIFGGGVDSFELSKKLAQLLHKWNIFDEAVFLGDNNNEIESIDSRFRSIKFGEALDQELNHADAVLTTASTSSLEILALEIPLGIFCAVSNQKYYFDYLGENNLAAKLGILREDKYWEIDEIALEKFLADSAFRQKLKNNSHSLIDCKGALRIVDKLVDMSLNIKPQ
jgi:spore coat polysaccharide biosynthesis predicted glycosyltransferase SpsG